MFRAKENGIKYRFSNKPKFVDKGNLYHYTNESQKYKDIMNPLVKKFDLDNLADMMINVHKNESSKKNKKAENRGNGNITRSVGYTSQNYKFITNPNVPTCKVTCPMPSKVITERDGYYFMLMTEVFRKMYYPDLTYKPEYEESKRISEWAARLPRIASNHDTHDKNNQQYNVFKSMTYGLTYLGDNQECLSCHVDQFNDKKEGLNVLMCVYFNFYHKKSKKCVRIVLLAYFQTVITEYYNRLDKRNMLLENLRKYYINLGDKQQLSYNQSIPANKIQKPQFIFNVASIDKCGFYSLFVYGLDILFNSFEKQNRVVYLHDVVEVVTPIGWLTTPHNYFLLLKEWSETKLPKGNLTIAIISGLVKKFGSLCGGKGQRSTVYCNKEISKWNVYKANNTIYQCIVKANSSSENIHRELLKTLVKEVYYVGELTAQHLLSVLTLFGVIHNKEYLIKAFLAQGTLTQKKLSKKFGLHNETVNLIYIELALYCISSFFCNFMCLKVNANSIAMDSVSIRCWSELLTISSLISFLFCVT